MSAIRSVRSQIMIVEDNSLIIEFVEDRLRREGYDVLVAQSCSEAVELLRKHTPDLIVLDIVLDDGLGYDLCRTIRQGGDNGALAHHADIPVLMLTARADEQDRLSGFQVGADDYMTKPFSPDELVFRVQAILRRSHGISHALVVRGPLTIDPRKRIVTVAGRPIELTPKEFDLLHLLASNPGRVFSREELFQRVWDASFLGTTRTVDVHVNRLRQKLVSYRLCEEMIGTEWGVGYKFVPEAAVLMQELGAGAAEAA